MAKQYTPEQVKLIAAYNQAERERAEADHELVLADRSGLNTAIPNALAREACQRLYTAREAMWNAGV